MAILNTKENSSRVEKGSKEPNYGGKTRPWWIICAAAFLIQLFVFGQQNCAGIVYATLIDEYKSSRGATAWVTSLAQSSSYTFGIVAAVICKIYGCRKVTLLAGVICGLGLVLSSFATSVFMLYFTYGILWGFGTCLVYFSSIVAITTNCQKQLALANGIAASGCAVGMLAQGPLLQLLFQIIGWAHTMRVLALFQVIFIMLGGLAFGSSSTKHEGLKQTYFDWNVFLKNRRFQMWLIALLFFAFALLIPYAHMVRFAEDIGASKEQASFLLMYMAISTVICRLVVGRIADCKRCNRVHILQFAFLLFGVSTTIVTIATHYYWIVIYLVIFGIVEGCYVTMMPVITADIVGRENVPSAFGGLMFLLSIFMVLGPPFAGWMFDVSQSYSLAFFVAGGSTVLSVCFMFIISVPSNDNREPSLDDKEIKTHRLKVFSSEDFVTLLSNDIIIERLTSV